MADDDVIDVTPDESYALVPANAAVPATLFRTDDPVEIVTRATEVAKALSAVIKQQGLTSRIGDKDYPRVEAWTLCGSMLGVFPVVEWTRPVEGGWEARVEARTRDGAIVGAAEAECLRSESKWKSRDDYAIRSMAQTRAVSKALRAPLGFVVALAGFEPTPAEEMSEAFLDKTRTPDPEKDLMPGAIHGKDAPKQIAATLNKFDPGMDWQAVIATAIGGQDWRELPADEQKHFWRRLSNAVHWIEQNTGEGDFPPVEEKTIMDGFAFAFSGAVVTLSRAPVVTEEVQSSP